jgi:hypothetical protein
MLYKLYISRSKPEERLQDSEMERIFKGFQEIYHEYGVKVIGAWENVDDPLESYMITAYNDAAHYDETVAKMGTNKKYQELSEELQASRETVQVVTLTILPGSPSE